MIWKSRTDYFIIIGQETTDQVKLSRHSETTAKAVQESTETHHCYHD